MTLTGRDVNGNRITRTITTAANGSYQFANLLAGSYSISEGATPGMAHSTRFRR